MAKKTVELGPKIIEMWNSGLTVSQINRTLGIGFQTVERWLHQDPTTRDQFRAEKEASAVVMEMELIRGMRLAISGCIDHMDSPVATVAGRARQTFNALYDTYKRHQREDAALEGLETRLAAIQEAQAELGHSSARPALQPVDVEVHASNPAETLPAVIDAEDPAE